MIHFPSFVESDGSWGEGGASCTWPSWARDIIAEVWICVAKSPVTAKAPKTHNGGEFNLNIHK